MGALHVIQLWFGAFAILFGVSGNALVLFAAYREKSLRAVPYMFVLNLCVCHLKVLLVPYLMFVIASGREKWDLSSRACNCQAYLAYTLSTEIMATMVLLSINRYVRIVLPVKYPFIFTQRSTVLMIATTWILATVSNIFPLIGYGKYGLNNKEDYMCALQVSTSVIQITVGGACVIISAVIIITCYVTIFYTIRAHYRQVRSAQRDTTTVQSNFNVAPRESRGEEIQIAMTLFLFVVIFGICWSPTVISVIINALTGRPTSHLAGLIRVNALILETVLDPIVYAIRNRKFRMVLRKTFKRHPRQSQS